MLGQSLRTVILLLLLGLVASVSGKTYDRCELARELKYVHEAPEEEIATWVCIAEHESQYNTSAVGHLNGDGSGDHGIFQINDEFWCSPPGKGWACGLTCAELEDDDIEDDFICAKRIYKEHSVLSGDGFNAWAVYKPHCKGSKAEKYTEGCFTGKDEPLPPKKKKMMKKVYPWQKPQQTSSEEPSTTPPTCAHKTSSPPPEINSVVPTVVSSVASGGFSEEGVRSFSVTPWIQSTTNPPESSIVTTASPRLGGPTTFAGQQSNSIIPSFTSSTSSIPRHPIGFTNQHSSKTSGFASSAPSFPRFSTITPSALFSSVTPGYVSSTFLQFGKGVSNAVTNRRFTSVTPAIISSTSSPFQTSFTFPTARRFSPSNSISEITLRGPPAGEVLNRGVPLQQEPRKVSQFIVNGRVWT